MITGVKKVICTCGLDMQRMGGVFGGGQVVQEDTYYCRSCEKYVLVLTPNKQHQEEFTNRIIGATK